jgi:crotonobetainyl-CoA:carnitine CoA-transferase CaiB-like acyl-CoA transferase
MDARVQNREYVNSLVQDWVGQNPSREVVQRLDEAEVAVGMINDAKDLVENEHIRARGNIVEITHLKIGKVKIPGVFPRLSVSPGAYALVPMFWESITKKYTANFWGSLRRKWITFAKEESFNSGVNQGSQCPGAGQIAAPHAYPSIPGPRRGWVSVSKP